MKTIELQAEFPANFPSLEKQLVKHPATVGKSPEKPTIVAGKTAEFPHNIITCPLHVPFKSDWLEQNLTKPNDFDPPTGSGFEGLRKVENAG
jgi:hypothetical protein